MAIDSSQIQLVVGVDQSASLKGFKDGINALIAEVNKDPPKIKIEVDTSSAKSIKSQIDSALKTASSSGSSVGTSLGAQFREATTEAQRLQSVFKSMSTTDMKNLESAIATLNGLSPDAAGKIAAQFAQIDGSLTSVTAKWKESVTTGKQVAIVTGTAKNELGDIITQTVTWNQETGEVLTSMQSVKQNLESTAKSQEKATAATNAGVAATTKAASVEKSYYSAIASCDSFLERYTAAKNSSNSASRAAYATVSQERSALESTYQAYKANTVSAQQLSSAVGNTNAKIKESTVVVRENGDATKTLAGRVSELAAKFSSWFSAYTIIIYITRAMKSLVSASVEIEDAMAQIQIVTGATDTQLTRFLSEATELAKELGQSITDVASSIETFSRLGYSFDEASSLAEYATILANVADTDVDTATTGLTSIIKGYSLEASDAEHIADVLVTVGQEYAISAEELMEAFERGGAALAATGATVEQSAGLFAATNAALQDASTTGTMWKTNYCLCV